MNSWIPLLIGIVAGLVSLYAAIQARGTESAKIGQVYTEKYLERLEKRVEKLEAQNSRLIEEGLQLREENQNLRNRLREAGIA